LTDYRLHQCFWHPAILSLTFGRQGGSHGSFIRSRSRPI